MKRTMPTPVGLRLLAIGLALFLPASGCGGLGALSFGTRKAWDEPIPPPPDRPIVQPDALTRLQLPNGLELLVLEDHTLPKVAMGVRVRRGAGSAPTAQAGIAELTTELLNRGAGDRDALALANAVDELGADLSTSADWDSMGVALSGLSQDTDTLLDLLTDVVLAPRFDPAEFEKAKAQHLAGLEGAKDDPGTVAGWSAMRAVYAPHRYGLPLEGRADTVSGLELDAVRRFFEARFIPNDAILWAVGDLDVDAFVAAITDRFGAWEPGKVVEDAPPPPAKLPKSRRVIIVDDPDLVQARITLLQEGLARDDDRRIAASLMNNVLGGSGFSSRMMQSLRSDAGLTYGVGSGFALRRQPGPFQVSTFTRVEKTAQALDILLEDLEAIRTTRPITEEELMEARGYAIGSFGLSLETSAAVLAGLVGLDVYGLPEDSLDTYRARIGAVSVEDVNDMARTLIDPARLAIVVLGPAADLGGVLERFGPIEIVKP